MVCWHGDEERALFRSIDAQGNFAMLSSNLAVVEEEAVVSAATAP